MSFPSGEMATELICPAELPAYDSCTTRNGRSNPPLRALNLNFPTIGILRNSRLNVGADHSSRVGLCDLGHDLAYAPRTIWTQMVFSEAIAKIFKAFFRAVHDLEELEVFG